MERLLASYQDALLRWGCNRIRIRSAKSKSSAHWVVRFFFFFFFTIRAILILFFLFLLTGFRLGGCGTVSATVAVFQQVLLHFILVNTLMLTLIIFVLDSEDLILHLLVMSNVTTVLFGEANAGAGTRLVPGSITNEVQVVAGDALGGAFLRIARGMHLPVLVAIDFIANMAFIFTGCVVVSSSQDNRRDGDCKFKLWICCGLGVAGLDQRQTTYSQTILETRDGMGGQVRLWRDLEGDENLLLFTFCKL